MPRGGGRGSAPSGICGLFWENGTCARSFECSFKHERKPVLSSALVPSSPGSSRDLGGGGEEDGEEENPDFFSSEGMLKYNQSVPEERHTLNPSELIIMSSLS